MNDKFWALLKAYRRRSRDPIDGRALTQELLSELISHKLGGDYPTAQTVSNWERDKALPRDRETVIILITVLHQYRGIASAEEADQLLTAATYAPLTAEEKKAVFADDTGKKRAEQGGAIIEEAGVGLSPTLTETGQVPQASESQIARPESRVSKPLRVFLVLFAGLLLVAGLLLIYQGRKPEPLSEISILVDDFSPQPYQGDSMYRYNRLGGDRGEVNSSKVAWGKGQVTTTVSSGNSWGGLWMSLNHTIGEARPLDFSAVFPPQILPDYQSQITGIRVNIARGTPGRTFRLELKDREGILQWKQEFALDGGQQIASSKLPALGDIKELLWVLDDASTGDFVVVESVSLTATTQIKDPAMAAFVWSYGMLLNNWDPATGLVRDKARFASGQFDAIQATGSLAAATTIAAQLDVVEREDARQIVKRIADALLLDTPRLHGLWPHFVTVSNTGVITIAEGTEWSSVDTIIAAIGLLSAQSGLSMDTSDTEEMIKSIDWADLLTENGISHGYTYEGGRIPVAWDVFGGESWLVQLAYAGATNQVGPISFSLPPTANGSGFIDELAWLFVPPPPSQDFWDADWTSYRLVAAENQISYYPTRKPASCLAEHNLFGLSAAEVPDISNAPQNIVYQAFGLGGHFASTNDGSEILGGPVVTPHYSAMIASLRPQEGVLVWDWLIRSGYFSPLTNVESLMFSASSSCNYAAATWNHLKGSWNLSLQTLGWGRYLAERQGQVPILWQATNTNPFLSNGYILLAPPDAQPSSAPTPFRLISEVPWTIELQNEDASISTVGQLIQRDDEEGSTVHGQFGTINEPPWSGKTGRVQYNIDIPDTSHLYLKLRYSKNSSPTVPILIFIDTESRPRATLYLEDLGSWDRFAWTEPIHLGDIEKGVHSIMFVTPGQQYGVADLDRFILTTAAATTP